MRNKWWLYAAWTVAGTVSFISLSVVILYGATFGKVKSALWMTSFLIAIVHKIIIADPVRISIIALWRIYRTRSPPPDYGFRKNLNPPKHQELHRIKRRLDYLMERFELGKWNVGQLNEQKQSEKMEATLVEYGVILKELVMFTFYIIALLLIVTGSKDDLSYYSTKYVHDFFTSGKDKGPVADRIISQTEMVVYLQKAILPKIHGSNSSEILKAPGFLDGGSIKLLGVARLRQHRMGTICSSRQNELIPPCAGYFVLPSQDNRNYSAQWKPWVDFTYYDEYWRLSQPWIYKSAIESETLPMFGESYLYPGGGYTANLGRNLNNSKHILRYLLQTNWIDNRTTVLFIELTLYSANANLFSIVTIVAERAPLGSYSVRVKIKTVKLLFLFSNLSWTTWLAVAIFLFLVTMLIYHLAMQVIFKEDVIQWSPWDYVDIILVALSIITLSLLFVRNAYVVSLLDKLESSRKNTFTSFYYAAIFDDFFTWISAILVCIATIRLWKILHFALVFRVLTKSLFRSAKSLASSIFLLAIFLIAISVALHIINGGNSARFSAFWKTFATLLAFTASLPREINTQDLQYGGQCLGIMLYALLEIVVIIFLLNMVLTIACFYFKQLKDEMSKLEKDKYTFWHFLQDEYYNIKEEIFSNTESDQKKESLRLRGGGGFISRPSFKNSKEDVSTKERSTIMKYTSEKAGLVNEIVTTQMDYLERYVDERLRDVQRGNREKMRHNEVDQSATSAGTYNQSSEITNAEDRSDFDTSNTREKKISSTSRNSKNYEKRLTIENYIRNV